MLSDISRSFKKKKNFIPYFTFAYPNKTVMEQLIEASINNGADIIEIGMPFSDPIADGPVIQQSHLETLKKYPLLSLDDLFDFVRKMRERYDIPFVLMLSVNLVMAYGIHSFFKRASQNRVSGVIIPDLPVEASQAYQDYAKEYKMGLIFLVSPLCTSQRLKKLVKASRGFVYLIATVGTTGEREQVDLALQEKVSAIKSLATIPVAIGFGISQKDHVKAVYEMADGVIIGSHLVKWIAKNKTSSHIGTQLGQKIKDLSNR